MPHFTTSDGLKLYYDEQGEGLPILCLSGLTRDSRDFDYVLPHLTGFRVIRLDYRGRGQSDWAEDHSSYTIPREAQDVLELLAHLSLDSVAVLGTSRGGLVAMGLAAGVPQVLRGVGGHRRDGRVKSEGRRRRTRCLMSCLAWSIGRER